MKRISILFAYFSISFLLLGGILTWQQILPWQVFSYFLVINLVTLLLFGLDKIKARKGQWRISEKSLFLFSLVGGWPSAFIALTSFNHKSNKKSFCLVLYLILVVNLSIYYFFISHDYL